jgi:hypothetical protein
MRTPKTDTGSKKDVVLLFAGTTESYFAAPQITSMAPLTIASSSFRGT